jgi:GTP-binding protein Era
MNYKSAVISIIGKPNAGKSTLLNRLIGHKISIVTPKVQTTRNMIQGIVTKDDTQLIFIDTPGIFEPKKSLEKAMVRAAWSSIVGADMVMLLLDCNEKMDEMQRKILERLRQNRVRFIVLVNKVDLMKPGAFVSLGRSGAEVRGPHETLESWDPRVKLEESTPEKNTFYISAKTGQGIEDLEKYLTQQAPEREWLYDEDDITNLPMRFLAAEITREQLFLSLQQELPYNLTVETEKWEEFRNGSVKINQVIIVARESQKGILLGKIKAIGEKSRAQIKELLGFDVHLFLFVKVRENWDSSLVRDISSGR